LAIRISNLPLPLEEPESSIPEHVGRLLDTPPQGWRRWRILRKSLDARDRDALRFVYSIEIDLSEQDFERVRALGSGHSSIRLEPYTEPPFVLPPPGERPLVHRPVVVGAGPAGMVATYFLAQQGYRPLVLERGRAVRDRIRDIHSFDRGGPLDPESNYLFGEGGAGTFSDGKLTCRNSGPDVRRVLELFAECKGKPSILYDYRPHLGSNRLPAVIKALRQKIQALGGEFHFSCRVEDLDIRDGRLCGLGTSSGYVPVSTSLLAIGHSARDTYRMLHQRGVPMVLKPFQMGVRIEQRQEEVNRVHYGANRWEDKLGAADYTLVARGTNDLFTFCMCAGGHIIPSVSAPGYFCTNGMSLSDRSSPFANSGLMITIKPEHLSEADVFAGVRLQEAYESKAFEIGGRDYLCPIQSAEDFLDRRVTKDPPPCSYSRGLVAAAIGELVPPVIVESLDHGLPIMDRRWRGRFLRGATLVGPEARGSSPLRIVRDARSRETPGIEGLYPIGEGAGYAGGIVSAAVDGLRSAKALIAKYARLEDPASNG
jgi:uncharacterized FAD-dependent dehydrogenase